MSTPTWFFEYEDEDDEYVDYAAFQGVVPADSSVPPQPPIVLPPPIDSVPIAFGEGQFGVDSFGFMVIPPPPVAPAVPESILAKLLAYPHRVFSKDPVQFLALRVTCDSGQLTWLVVEGILTLTPGGTTLAAPLSIDLSNYTIQALALFLSSQPGYQIVYSDSSSKQLLSALALIESSGNVKISNGDHLYAFTNLLYAYFTANAVELEIAQAQIVNMLAQMSTATAEGEFLDVLGTYYRVPRDPGELDGAYSPRIPASVLLPSTNNVGMAIALEALYPSVSISIPDAVTNLGSLLTYNGAINFNGLADYDGGSTAIADGLFDIEAIYTFGVGAAAPTTFEPILLASVLKYRAGGTYPRNLILMNGPNATILVDNFTDGLVNVFIYDVAQLADDSAIYAYAFQEDDEDDNYVYSTLN